VDAGFSMVEMGNIASKISLILNIVKVIVDVSKGPLKVGDELIFDL